MAQKEIVVADFGDSTFTRIVLEDKVIENKNCNPPPLENAGS